MWRYDMDDDDIIVDSPGPLDDLDDRRAGLVICFQFSYVAQAEYQKPAALWSRVCACSRPKPHQMSFSFPPGVLRQVWNRCWANWTPFCRW